MKSFRNGGPARRLGQRARTPELDFVVSRVASNPNDIIAQAVFHPYLPPPLAVENLAGAVTGCSSASGSSSRNRLRIEFSSWLCS
jgi:hypothetical protein